MGIESGWFAEVLRLDVVVVVVDVVEWMAEVCGSGGGRERATWETSPSYSVNGLGVASRSAIVRAGKCAAY